MIGPCPRARAANRLRTAAFLNQPGVNSMPACLDRQTQTISLRLHREDVHEYSRVNVHIGMAYRQFVQAPLGGPEVVVLPAIGVGISCSSAQ